MEEKLQAIIAAIDDADLSDTDKDTLLAQIQQGLRAIVQPVLVKYLPQNQLTELSAHPEMITVDSWVNLVGPAVTDGRAIAAIATTMEELLDTVTTTLAANGIVVPHIVQIGASS